MLMNLVAAMDFETIKWWVDVVLKVAVALGTVVFVHELGHFLMAKACGVKVEKFMLGFDIGGYKIAKRFGETVYGIGILPLGGYVKMFGQDDDPSHIAEQLQNSQISSSSADAVEKIGPNGEKYYIDRRSYLAKSVPQRMAIISAGVIMNVIFAFIFAVIAYSMGVRYMPCVVAETMPGSPAWQLGLEPGDEIVMLGDRLEPTFLQLKGGVTLGNLESGIPVQIRRAATGETKMMTLRPTQEKGELATVGLTNAQTLTLWDGHPVVEGSAASRATLLTTGDVAKGVEPKLQGNDTIVSINDVPVKDFREYSAELAKSWDKPLVIGVRRPLKGAKGSESSAEENAEPLSFEVPTQPLLDLGLVMKMGPVATLQNDSPAEKAGMKPGDVIVTVDDQPIAGTDGNLDSWTPLTLPEYLQRAAMGGREVKFTVRRKTESKPEGEEFVFNVKPLVATAVHSNVPIGAPLASDAVGIAYRIENTVQAVAPNGAAAKAGLAAGDKILAAKIVLPAAKNGKTPDPVPVELGMEHWNWGALVDSLQFAPSGTTVELQFLRGDAKDPQTVVIEPQALKDTFIAQRGFVFEPVYRMRQATSLGEAVRFGWEETTEALTMVFRFLQKLGGQVPFKMLGGPGTIAVAAGDAASQGLSALLMFLTMLSANLAVINFLPIPLLDGGHMVFLAYEGIRGRPANERFVLAMHMAGFVFIISLMLFVIGLDIDRWIL